MQCPACGAGTPGGVCIFCGADDPRGGMDQAAVVTWSLRLTGLGCAGLLIAFVGLLFWGVFRPGVFERNQGDHPSLRAAREMITRRRFSSALEALQKAPPRSALTADYRGLALLGINGVRVVRDTTFTTPVSRARDAFQEAISLDAELAPAYLHLATCQAMLHEDKSIVQATLDKLPEAAGAMYPVDSAHRDNMLFCGRTLQELVEAGAPFVGVVGDKRARSEEVRTFNLDVGY